MPTNTATATTPPTDTDPHRLAPDTRAPDTRAPDTAASDTAASDTAASDTAAPQTTGRIPESREAHTSAGDGPAGGSAAGRARAGDVEDRVWAALRRHPGATAAELATEASVSRSAVGKLLAAWAADGSATSTPGDKPRAARRWTAAPTHNTTTTEPVTTADTAAPDNTSADEVAARTPDRAVHLDAINTDAISEPPDSGIGNEIADTEDESHRDADHEDEAAPGSAKAGDPSSPAEGQDEAHNNDEADAAEAGKEVDDRKVDDTERDGTATAGSEGGAPAHRAGRATGGGSGRPRTPTRNRSGSSRLGKGALRGQVEDYLAETPGEHSPVEIGKVLGRSSGAIANALESLVESGDAVRTSDRPRRYSHSEHADDVDRTGSDSDSDSDGGAGAVPARGQTRTRRPGRGVSGVGTYVTVLAVLPLDSTGAISTDEIADWFRARMMPEPVLFASAAHGVTRAALSAGADPSDWSTTTRERAMTDDTIMGDAITDDTTTGDTTAGDTTTEGATTDDIAADPTARGEGEQPQQRRAESGAGA